ncbi:uncharacterized protein LOC133175478 [Saccostrea echinata]|uniref:uncharacterized protein LOC133171818 n=1 Tax=Saccostrea echinata TaxID=191078 RepID=UPI002A802E52|nr:uncharacterized protein LOC133171818 [Saccostrea echinata]XP_061166562.1 uncharacterized protein LOC133175478 [Saccostrea echinata]
MQQDIIITLSVCAVIITAVFFEYRMQQLEEKCKEIETRFQVHQKSGKRDNTVDSERETDDEKIGKVEATLKRHNAGDLMEDEIKELSAQRAVAFSAALGSPMEDNETVSEIVIYNIVEINIGEAYDPTTGIFMVPESGVYAFSWTSVTIPGKWYETEMNINGLQKRLNSCNNKGETASSNLSCTSMVIAEVKKGDIVWIAKFGQEGDYLMEMYSSFSGWKIGEISKSDVDSS